MSFAAAANLARQGLDVPGRAPGNVLAVPEVRAALAG